MTGQPRCSGLASAAAWSPSRRRGGAGQGTGVPSLQGTGTVALHPDSHPPRRKLLNRTGEEDEAEE